MTTKTAPKPDPTGEPDGWPLVLAGKPVTLRCSAMAMMKVSSAFGGLIPAGERVRALDLAALGTVVHVGLGRPATGSAIEKTLEAVCASDITEVALACSGLVSRMIAGPSKAEKDAA